MKSNLFTFLRENIPVGRDVLNKIQYYPFVQHLKLQFIRKYRSEFEILNKNRETMVYRHYFRQSELSNSS